MSEPATSARGVECRAGFSLPDGRRVEITASSRDAALAAVEARLAADEGFTLVTLNLDHLVKLRRSDGFRRAYCAATVVTADGAPIVWLSRLAGRRVSLAPGSELIDPLCALAARRRAPVALFGSAEETLARAGAVLTARHPGLSIVYAAAAPRGFDPEGPAAGAFAAQIGASGARLCFVALGAPKQELFSALARTAAPACGMVSIGAGLDFIAGAQHRAPIWVRRIALEWLWRMLGDPHRLAGRYAACAAILPSLALSALRERATLDRPSDASATLQAIAGRKRRAPSRPQDPEDASGTL